MITFLPTSLSQPSGLFNLQLLRVLRLQRFLQDLDSFEKFTGTRNVVKAWQLQLARVVLSLFTLLSVSSGLIYTAENVVNPNINNYFDALYFGLTTLTTVGFGDVNPVTWQGRLVVCGSIIVAAALLEALLDRENIKSGGSGWGGSGSTRKGTSSTTTSSMISTDIISSNRSNDDDNEAILALNTKVSCDRCGASFHWSSARYCYSCGEEL
ncbi:voltage-gated potassium channel [Fragilariopsis cylindrus CCMP1102]|uniref:Voltage-gated potassium channel n=1 Tax=Fragilariopsis cylindrus CCMP1102 TaxID=635003 RepID=A0A1E7FKG2_9STRA|nr:voltage-gated potassium channel [Fragilariopsis cylindrus CCMP1102]|eukprot:OEU18669.1 voltage-gated potassium channel [Fragilariopsis cylindrus CCMP1102]